MSGEMGEMMENGYGCNLMHRSEEALPDWYATIRCAMCGYQFQDHFPKHFGAPPTYDEFWRPKCLNAHAAPLALRLCSDCARGNWLGLREKMSNATG